MITINPYLNFNGNAEEAFNFYKSVFGGEFTSLQRFKDIPEMPDGKALSESDKEKIMHITLPMGKVNMLMASDILESFGQTKAEGNNFYISINAESREEADRLFKGLAEGGKIEMPIGDTFWGAYFGTLSDKFGIKWMFHYEHNQNE